MNETGTTNNSQKIWHAMTRRKENYFLQKIRTINPGMRNYWGKKFRRQRVFHAARTAIHRRIFLLVRDTPTKHQHTGKINYVPSLKKSKKSKPAQSLPTTQLSLVP